VPQLSVPMHVWRWCPVRGYVVQGKFGLKLLQSLNPDPKLLGELHSALLLPPMPPPAPALSGTHQGEAREGGGGGEGGGREGARGGEGGARSPWPTSSGVEMRVAAPP